jgi:hypothetical protein
LGAEMRDESAVERERWDGRDQSPILLRKVEAL